MTKVILFNKPYGVISQFSPNPPHSTLKDYIKLPGVYPAGRLDTDSEGLLILTNDGKLQAKISDPKYKKFKTYWVQVEGNAHAEQLEQLRNGVDLGEFVTAKALVRPSQNRQGYGSACHRYAFVKPFQLHGWSYPFVKVRIGKCGG